MNFIKNIAKKYIYKYCIIRCQKIIFYNNFIIFNIQSKKFIYNNLVKFLFSINFNSCKYFMIFKNNFIFYFEIYYIRYKNEIFVIFLKFKIYFKLLNFKICRIHLDNKKKYIFKIFLDYFFLM